MCEGSCVMKIRFIVSPPGRPEYKKGDVREFNGRIEEGYARKYVARGWAEEVVEAPAVLERPPLPERRPEPQPELIERGPVEIPENYADLSSAELRALAERLTGAKYSNKTDALAVIRAEIEQRAAAQ